LLADFNLNVENRTDVQSTPTAGGYYGYRAGYDGAWAGYPVDLTTTHHEEAGPGSTRA
jgi:hypothetical protein